MRLRTDCAAFDTVLTLCDFGADTLRRGDIVALGHTGRPDVEHVRVDSVTERGLVAVTRGYARSDARKHAAGEAVHRVGMTTDLTGCA